MVVLLVCRTMLLDAGDAAAAPMQCLTPATEQAVRELFDAGTLQTTLGPDLTLTGVSVTGTRIEVRAQSAGGGVHGIDLVVGATERPPDGQGRRFAYLALPPAAPESIVRALLATADLIDRTVPEAAFVDCGPSAAGVHGGLDPTMHRRRGSALIRATAQVLILLAATIFGWRALRSP